VESGKGLGRVDGPLGTRERLIGNMYGKKEGRARLFNEKRAVGKSQHMSTKRVDLPRRGPKKPLMGTSGKTGNEVIDSTIQLVEKTRRSEGAIWTGSWGEERSRTNGVRESKRAKCKHWCKLLQCRTILPKIHRKASKGARGCTS